MAAILFLVLVAAWPPLVAWKSNAAPNRALFSAGIVASDLELTSGSGDVELVGGGSESTSVRMRTRRTAAFSCDGRAARNINACHIVEGPT